MSTFTETLHPRAGSGEFVRKQNRAPAGELSAPDVQLPGIAAYEQPRPEDVEYARASLIISIRNDAYPQKLTWEEAEALIDQDKLHDRAAFVAKLHVPERMFVDGAPHPQDDHFEAIWAGEANGFGEEHCRRELDRLKSLRIDLAAGRTRPRDIIGTGLKGDTRKIANDYLNTQQAMYERALVVRGRNLSVNVSNAMYVARTQNAG